MVTINNKEYAWGDIQVYMLGLPITGLKGIEYKSTKEKEHRFGAGRNPLGIQHGKRTYTGTLTITQNELQAINSAARAKGFKDILDIELDIVVSYIPEDSKIIAIHRIIGASFSEIPQGMKEDDKFSQHALPFIALNIEN